MKKAVFPGSFDPITNGHIDVVKRALKIFDKIIIAVAKREEKSPIFTMSEREQLIKKVLGKMSRVEIKSFDGLLVDFVRKEKACAIIRGLRTISDFDYEFQMALTNRKIAPEIETIFFLASEQYAYLSATLIKEIGRMGGNLKDFVPKPVILALEKRLKEKRLKF
ncbi:MAG: pantetheine-phosphate adenylyltransferase [candidate division WOR-3 bacterium]|nr:pantetheine-phosphate adenylyltransferase [candidate division WOR-3 bacterium]